MKVLRVDMAWCRFCRPDALQLVGVEAVLSSIVRGIGCGGAMFRRSATRADENNNRTSALSCIIGFIGSAALRT